MSVDIHISFTKEKGETLFMHALKDATLKPLIHWVLSIYEWSTCNYKISIYLSEKENQKKIK